MTPFTLPEGAAFPGEVGDYVYIPGLRAGILAGQEEFAAKLIHGDTVTDLTLLCRGLTENERKILTEGCLMNYYAAGYGKD